eukprot:7391157-Prymnesium_polylepis.2
MYTEIIVASDSTIDAARSRCNASSSTQSGSGASAIGVSLVHRISEPTAQRWNEMTIAGVRAASRPRKLFGSRSRTLCGNQASCLSRTAASTTAASLVSALHISTLALSFATFSTSRHGGACFLLAASASFAASLFRRTRRSKAAR